MYRLRHDLGTALSNAPIASHPPHHTAAAAHASLSPIVTRCTAGAQKKEMVARIMEEMKAAAEAAELEEGASDDEEAMSVTQVKEKLEALTEAELKQMLKEMKLPTKGKVRAPAPLTMGRASATPP